MIVIIIKSYKKEAKQIKTKLNMEKGFMKWV